MHNCVVGRLNRETHRQTNGETGGAREMWRGRESEKKIEMARERHVDDDGIIMCNCSEMIKRAAGLTRHERDVETSRECVTERDGARDVEMKREEESGTREAHMGSELVPLARWLSRQLELHLTKMVTRKKHF